MANSQHGSIFEYLNYWIGVMETENGFSNLGDCPGIAEKSEGFKERWRPVKFHPNTVILSMLAQSMSLGWLASYTSLAMEAKDCHLGEKVGAIAVPTA